MNEITRIHIAKNAYDIEISAKKQLEKYMKSLEVYTQDKDVIADIEIRMTEILAERGVAANGVIETADVVAVRAQLGEPYEFADGEGDVAVGADVEKTTRRFYRSTDDAVLGGVLSGIAAYFAVNPLWTRLIFVLLLFISFGFASLLYILFWIITPAARTATEKLQLAGKDVTLESIKKLNDEEETTPRRRIAPVLQRIIGVTLGSFAALAAAGVFIGTVVMIVSAFTLEAGFIDVTNGFTGLGDENIWLVWLLFWVVVAGLLLLTALFGLIAYALFAKKLTKRMIISGVVIIALGIASVATVVSVSATQSLRVANETRSMVRDTKVTLPKEFANVKSVTFERKTEKSEKGQPIFGSGYVSVRYVVDEAPARYEFSGLPNAKTSVKINGSSATVTLDVPESFRNSFVQPSLVIYGPALEGIEAKTSNIQYEGQRQDAITVNGAADTFTILNGVYATVTVDGTGTVDLGSSTVRTLSVKAEQNISVVAGTVRELSVELPEVCPSGANGLNAVVTVNSVTSGQMTYNGTVIPAASHKTSCSQIVVLPNQGDDTGEYEEESNY